MKEESLRKRWEILDAQKEQLHTRNERYARWTLPYLYPCEDRNKNDELESDLDSVGARAVNHLSNKLVETLFPSYRPFLRLEMSEEVELELEQAQVPLTEVDKALVRGEKRTVRTLDRMGHRTAATTATKQLIVTGNALMYYPIGSKCQVYSTRDYCVVRDIAGNVIEMVLRDIKAFETFTDAVKDKLQAERPREQKEYEDDTAVTLYTRVLLNDNKYEVTQAADAVMLDVNRNSYAKKDLPWLPLTWNLSRGEDYGRGMVEDYSGAFGALDILSQALIEGIVSSAALKFLVKPSSVIDIEELNKSHNGSYHSGEDGDIVAVKSDKHIDFQQVKMVIEDFTRQIAQAFLLNSTVTRDAERVTAEEIRFQAQELEMAYGGIYSRFTEDWQEPVARLLLSAQNITVSDQEIYPVVVTGLDTLSRMGDLDNFRMFMNDLSLINAVPETIQQRLKTSDLLMWVGNARGVDYTRFVKTEQEFQQEQQAAMQQQQAMMQQETEQNLTQTAGEELIKQEE